MKTISFQITDDAFDLLKSINNTGCAEYRDPEFDSLEEFEKSPESSYKSKKWFLTRNYDGTLYLIYELLKYNLVTYETFSWHPTYVLSEFGKRIISENQP